MPDPSEDANTKQNSKSDSGHERKWLALFCRVLGAITVEPMMFLHASSMMMMFVIAQSLKIYKICRGTFGHSIEICRNLTHYTDLEKEVQEVASDYGMYWAVIQTVPSVIFIMFLGPWSDRYGRKLPMAMPLVGAILASIVFILSAQYEELPPLFLLVGPAFAGLSGGMMAMVMALFSYISDISTPETRTIRLGFVYGVWFLGSPAGSVLGGVLMKYYGYTTVFIVGTILLTFCLIYLLVRIREAPLPQAEGSRPSKGCFKDLFDTRNVVDSFRTCLKWRQGNKRCHIWLLMVAICAMFLPITGEGNVRFLYTRLRFNWDATKFSYYTACILAVGAFGVMVVMPFMTKVLKVSDALMAILAIVTKIIAEAVTAFSVGDWMMYAASASLLYECSGPPIRSLMTKCVEPNEVGKMFTVLAIIESGIPIMSGVMYSKVYNATMTNFPGTVFMVSAVVYLAVVLAMIWLIRDTEKQEAIASKNQDVEKNKDSINGDVNKKNGTMMHLEEMNCEKVKINDEKVKEMTRF